MPKVLIIEDETAYQKILKETLQKEQFEVFLASQGKQGMAGVIRNRPDIILLDIILPGGTNGFDFLEQLKANESMRDIPVIVITNLANEEKTAKEIGADFYFVKSDTTIPQIIEKAKELLKGVGI